MIFTSKCPAVIAHHFQKFSMKHGDLRVGVTNGVGFIALQKLSVITGLSLSNYRMWP